jgi:hypothetical protein
MAEIKTSSMGYYFEASWYFHLLLFLQYAKSFKWAMDKKS